MSSRLLTPVARAHDEAATLLHDPARRKLLLAVEGWEVRWPPGHGGGIDWARTGLWHVQLWYPRQRASVLVFLEPQWIRHDVLLPHVGRFEVASDAELTATLGLHSIEVPCLPRVRLLASVARDRAIGTLATIALAAASDPAHGAQPAFS